jgi:hypothetical protein
MRVSTLTTSLTAASLASAVITGITAPSTLAPNNTFSLTLISENYIQSVAYIAVAWGFDLAPAHPGALGPYSDSAYVSPSLSMLVLKNKTRRVLFWEAGVTASCGVQFVGLVSWAAGCDLGC